MAKKPVAKKDTAKPAAAKAPENKVAPKLASLFQKLDADVSAMEIAGAGCVVSKGGALCFVPGVKIVSRVPGDVTKGKKLVVG